MPLGMDMTTPPKTPVVENPPARAPSPLMWVGIIAVISAVAAMLLPPLLPPAPPSEVANPSRR
jgi:hypothetical protein